MTERLYRSRDERILFGVAGGVAERLDIDPALVRIVFALLVLSAGVGLLLYVVMTLVIPEEPEDFPAPPAPATPGEPAESVGPPVDPTAVAAWADARQARSAARRAARTERDGRGVMIFGAILVLIGCWFLIRRFVPALDADLVWPVILIVVGGVLLAGAVNRGDSGGSRTPPSLG